MGRVVSSIGGIILLSAVSVTRSEAAVTLTTSLSFSENYTDNFFFSNANREGEWTTILSPRAGLVFSNRAMTVSADYQVGIETHIRHPEANGYRQVLSLNFDLPFLSYQVKGMRVQVIENVTYAPELPPFPFTSGQSPSAATSAISELSSSFSDSSFQAANQGIQNPRADTFQNRAGVIVSYPWTPRFNTALSYINLLTRYKGSELENSTAHDGSIKGSFQQTPLTAWSVSLGISYVNYERASGVVSERFTVGVSHELNRSVSLNGNIGLASIRDGSTEGVFDIGVLKKYRSVILLLRYNQGIGTGGGLTSSPTLSQMVTGEATLNVAENASLFFQAAYGRNTSLSGERVEISSYQAGTGLNLLFLSWLSGGIRYSYLNQQARGTIGVDATRNLVMLTLTARASQWKIIN